MRFYCQHEILRMCLCSFPSPFLVNCSCLFLASTCHLYIRQKKIGICIPVPPHPESCPPPAKFLDPPLDRALCDSIIIFVFIFSGVHLVSILNHHCKPKCNKTYIYRLHTKYVEGNVFSLSVQSVWGPPGQCPGEAPR